MLLKHHEYNRATTYGCQNVEHNKYRLNRMVYKLTMTRGSEQQGAQMQQVGVSLTPPLPNVSQDCALLGFFHMCYCWWWPFICLELSAKKTFN